MLSDETTLDQLGTDAPASKVLTLVRVKASPPVPSPDGRAAACYRPLHIQLSPSNKPFFAPAFEEPSAQWRVRYMFDRGFRSGAAAATVVSFTTVGFVGGVGGGAALGLVGGCTSVLCRSCAGRPLELRWVTTDFKDAAFAGEAWCPSTWLLLFPCRRVHWSAPCWDWPGTAYVHSCDCRVVPHGDGQHAVEQPPISGSRLARRDWCPGLPSSSTFARETQSRSGA